MKNRKFIAGTVVFLCVFSVITLLSAKGKAPKETGMSTGTSSRDIAGPRSSSSSGFEKLMEVKEALSEKSGESETPASGDTPETTDDGTDMERGDDWEDEYDDPNDPQDPDDPYDYPYDEPQEPQAVYDRDHLKKMTREIKYANRIVALGASAGSAAPIKDILANVSMDLLVAYVIVQHPTKEHTEITKDALSAMTNITVVEVTEDTLIEGNRIYLIPSGKDVVVFKGQLMMRSSGRPTLPINSLFSSLAEDQEVKVVGVILSGNAEDGVLGLKKILDKDGDTIAQKADTAEYDRMPGQAISSGVAEMVLSPKEIGLKLNTLGVYEKDSSVIERHD